MPNWCTNKLIVRGTPDDLRKFVEKANETTHLDWKASKYEKQDGPQHIGPLNFSAFIPLPDWAPQFSYGDSADGSRGYDWCIANWGTKWHVPGKQNFERLENEEENIQAGKILYEFNTAWSPASRVVEAMAEQFPTLFFLLKFREEDSYYGEFIKCVSQGIHEDNTYERPPWPEYDEENDEFPEDPTDGWWADEGDGEPEELKTLNAQHVPIVQNNTPELGS